MRITNIEVVLEDRPGFPPGTLWRKNIPGPDTSTTGAWLVIETDAGITGFASAPRGIIFKDYVDRRFRDEFIGQDPLMREHLWERVWSLIASNVLHQT